MKQIPVVAAVLWDGNRFLASKRPEGKARERQWEFLGGKVEPGETEEEALIRECRKELGVTVEVGKPLIRLEHSYPDVQIRLTAYEARITEGTPVPLEHEQIRWVTAEEAEELDFCPADRDILAMIKQSKENA